MVRHVWPYLQRSHPAPGLAARAAAIIGSPCFGIVFDAGRISAHPIPTKADPASADACIEVDTWMFFSTSALVACETNTDADPVTPP